MSWFKKKENVPQSFGLGAYGPREHAERMKKYMYQSSKEMDGLIDLWSGEFVYHTVDNHFEMNCKKVWDKL